MINAAMVGLGRWGQYLVESVQGSSTKIQFSAGVTRTKSKAEGFCADHGIDLRDSYEDVINDPAIDAVVLATPHTQHAEQIIAAAKAGKHVFTEKPFTLNHADAVAAVNACAEAGVTIALGHNRRFMANTRVVRALIDEGKLGTLLHIDGNQSSNLGMASDTWRDSRGESPAGGMTSLGIHALDCMIYMGGRITDVDAFSEHRAINLDIDDATACIVRFEEGMTGTLVTLASSPRLWHLRVVGTDGWAETTDNYRVTVCLNGGEPEVRTFPDSEYPHMESLSGELEAFAEAASGGAPYIITPDQMVHGVAVLEAIIKSAETGNRVAVAG